MSSKSLSKMENLQFWNVRDVEIKRRLNSTNPKEITPYKRYHPSHRREAVSFITDDLELIKMHEELGWTYHKIKEGFRVRAPEEWLVDLSDPYKIMFYADYIINFAYYLYLNDLKKNKTFEKVANEVLNKYNLKNLNVFLLEGESLETEIRVAGTDKRIKFFKDVLFAELKSKPEWSYYEKIAKEQLGTLRYKRPKMAHINVKEEIVQNFFYRAKELYKNFKLMKEDKFNKEFIQDLFRDIPLDFDVYVFIPNSCFQYVFSFVNESNIKKIMFLESHAGIKDALEGRFFSKQVKGKRVLIIDNSYSGSTLNKAADIIKKEGGITKKLALFPKSRLSFNNADYFLFINKIYKKEDINLTDQDWKEKLYIKTVKYKNGK